MIVKKNKSMYKYIQCDPYKRGISVFIGSCEDLKKWARKFYNNTCEEDLVAQIEEYCNDSRYTSTEVSASTYSSTKCGHQVVHIPCFSFSYSPAEITNLSHEILHAVFGILDYVGVEYRYGGANEAYTYLYEYALKEALTVKGYKNV